MIYSLKTHHEFVDACWLLASNSISFSADAIELSVAIQKGKINKHLKIWLMMHSFEGDIKQGTKQCR